MYYRHELFYRILTVPIHRRARLYHYACRLAQRGKVVVSTTDTYCKLWISLRNSTITADQTIEQSLPPHTNMSDAS